MSFILLPMLRSLAAESQCFHLVRILRESVVGPRPELEFGSGISRSCGTLRYTDRNLSSGLRRALGYRLGRARWIQPWIQERALATGTSPTRRSDIVLNVHDMRDVPVVSQASSLADE